MANQNLTVTFKNTLSEDEGYQKAFRDAVIDKAYDYVAVSKPFDGFVAGDKLKAFSLNILKGQSVATRNRIRAFLSQFPDTAQIDDADIVAQYNATFSNLDSYFELLADVSADDKTTAS